MPYVPPEVKERLKREISVQRLAEARGIQLRPSGKAVRACEEPMFRCQRKPDRVVQGL